MPKLLSNFCLWALLAAFVSSPAHAKIPGFQTSFSTGIDYAGSEAKRGNAYFLNGQLGTYPGFFRLHGAFTLLYGSGYQAGEGALGLAIYPISSFVSERASIHPFLLGQGIVSAGRASSQNSFSAGYSYGAGVDLNWWRRAGLTLSAQQVSTGEKSMRYSIGIYWFRGAE